MKKFLAMLLCLLMVLSLAACGAKQEEVEPEGGEEPMTGVANPWVDYASLEEINAEVGCNLRRPAAMGVSEEHFAVGDMGDYKMAQYQFTMGGYDYTFRCAPSTGDISGIWDDVVKAAFAEPCGDKVELVESDTYKAARWMTIDGQYVLSLMDDGEMALETFDVIAREMMDLTTMDMFNDNGENG